jgi:hypothetical protein
MVVVHNHYKALVLKKEAEKFWGLRPKAEDAGGGQEDHR